ncbi:MULTISPECIES: ferritin [Chryseobacterium]|uniref:Ferritin n=1 Tax=Chryseobacterium candidae TaxID=1978493 RepID=A0ABY2R2C7_9FLAO|nr:MULTISPECIES: ferritin [Chryseobacterium]THV56399.1 ferritin [Chryseobacterium candidae]SIR51271.1 ferritin [Chryseobacterium sp. RU33C]
MNTKRLSTNMEKALSDQMNKEIHASHIFLSYGIWADDKGYQGIANFLYRHAQEERNHSIKFMEYILNRGGKPKVTAIPAPPADPKTLTACFDGVFKHEVDNTTAIYKIVDLSMEEKDWATWNFMQWFVQEQIEEETLAQNLIDKLKIAGGDRATDESLFTLDKALQEAPNDVPLAQNATGANP